MSKTKVCGRCKRRKAVSAFPRKLAGRASFCKECHRSYSKEHYRKHRQKYLERNIFYQAKVAEDVALFIAAAKDHPCVNCGQDFPSYVKDFDHVRGVKKESVSRMLRGKYSIAQIAAEIAKCDLVCANCHRIRTYGKFLSNMGAKLIREST